MRHTHTLLSSPQALKFPQLHHTPCASLLQCSPCARFLLPYLSPLLLLAWPLLQLSGATVTLSDTILENGAREVLLAGTDTECNTATNLMEALMKSAS